jgi:DNA end-binding protein Ku
MAPRPNWKGYLKLSLVSCPIALYPATSGSERVSFRQVNKETGNRLRQQLVDSVTGDVVTADQKGRGYEVGKNQFLMIEDEELEAIQIESTRTIEIDSFVPREQIDPRYIDSPYYITPEGNVGQEAFAVIREAMRGKDMVALGRVVMAKREYVMMLEPFKKGLRATTVRYPYEVRDESAYFDEIPDLKIPAEMRQLAEHILESKRADFDPSKFEDRYELALTEMLRRKQAGMPAPEATPAALPSNVVNLMDALRRSIAQEAKSAPKEAPKPAAAKKGKRRVAGQREMLLPIAGKGTGKESAEKKPARSSGRQRKAG